MTTQGITPGPINDKRHTNTHDCGLRQPGAWTSREKGLRGTLLLQAVFLGGRHTTTHLRGQPKALSNHRLLNALNIGGLIGSLERGSPKSAHTHTISLLHLPNYLALAQNKRKLLTFQRCLWQWLSFFLDSPKIVGQNSPQRESTTILEQQDKLRLCIIYILYSIWS